MDRGRPRWAPEGGRTVTEAVSRRRWTRVGTVAMAAHVFYELLAGVGMPFASRLGPWTAAATWGLGSVAVYREAARQPPERDVVFALLNGFFLSAALAHFAAWPRTRLAGVPWLTECEGLRGRLMPPYNLLLHLSAAAAVAGLVENRRGAAWAALVPVVAVPVTVREQHREVERLRDRARRDPSWWNRRLR